jgi:hypothetical protein
MTTFEALVSISLMVLRHRGQWHGGATAFADIEVAVSDSMAAIRGDHWPNLVTLHDALMAIGELKRRAGIAAAIDEIGSPSRPQVLIEADYL